MIASAGSYQPLGFALDTFVYVLVVTLAIVVIVVIHIHMLRRINALTAQVHQLQQAVNISKET